MEKIFQRFHTRSNFTISSHPHPLHHIKSQPVKKWDQVSFRLSTIFHCHCSLAVKTDRFWKIQESQNIDIVALLVAISVPLVRLQRPGERGNVGCLTSEDASIPQDSLLIECSPPVGPGSCRWQASNGENPPIRSDSSASDSRGRERERRRNNATSVPLNPSGDEGDVTSNRYVLPRWNCPRPRCLLFRSTAAAAAASSLRNRPALPIVPLARRT